MLRVKRKVTLLADKRVDCLLKGRDNPFRAGSYLGGIDQRLRFAPPLVIIGTPIEFRAELISFQTRSNLGSIVYIVSFISI
jgi:hypothetical protein